ncbi:MAG: ATP-binding cassette domain-containing protein [Bacilli bacterium]
MLELKKINKIYETDNFKQKALDNVSVNFRSNEFASILGPSGSGKTTLLNIIGGLDHYTSGDLIINETSTKEYNDRDWDSYRNHRVGFVFQNYNLIPHQSILANVELALTLSGVSKAERRKKAKLALKKVGLQDHLNKKPNQLSGGQMQRVAIARALVNDPDILLADEPTGALDTKTSVQIMELIKEIAKDKLVIMVTHNPELAQKYSTRIIELKDGKIVSDSDPYNGKVNTKEELEIQKKKTKKTSMNLKTALSLSLNNLMTKKGRTILTAFAGSIGIIGIALILSLSNGVSEYIKRVQEETLTSYPLTIEESSIDITSTVDEKRQEILDGQKEESEDDNKIYSNNTIGDTLSLMSSKASSNNLKAFKEFIESNESNIKDYTTAIGYEYNLNLQLFKSDTSEEIVQVNPNTVLESMGMASNSTANNFIITDVWSEMFENDEVNEKMYTIVSGRIPQSYNEVVLLVDKNNKISDYVLYALGIKDQKELKEFYKKIQNGEEIETEEMSFDYDELIGLSYKLLLNTDYYTKVNGVWVDKSEDTEYLKSKLENSEEIKIVGIVKPSEEWTGAISSTGGILYTDELEKYVIEKINNSEIVKEQKENPNINVITGLEFSNEEFSIDKLSSEQKKYLQSLPTEELATIISKYKEQSSATYESVLSELGSVDLEIPTAINIYAKDFESKDEIKNIINDYNNDQEEKGNEGNIISYNDLVGMLMSSVTNIVDMISYVLIGFVSISLVVSSIMIGIITYISVLERTKEIGILRAIGASKKDVTRVFNAETLIIGLTAGIIGITLTLILNIPINLIINKLAGVSNLSMLPLSGGIILIIISVVLTMVAGLIPSRLASKKDPVESLRSE